jgi:hypothetical protein
MFQWVSSSAAIADCCINPQLINKYRCIGTQGTGNTTGNSYFAKQEHAQSRHEHTQKQHRPI